MPTVPTNTASETKTSQVNNNGPVTNQDITHYLGPDGSIVSWINNEGVGQGALAAIPGPPGPPGPGGSTNPSILYASPSGNDNNNGLTWQTAKATVVGALIALPGGSTGQCGNGVVYFADGTPANTISGAGLWLMGPNDPNYANLPVGWLRAPSGGLNIIGVGGTNSGPNPHIPRATLNGPPSSSGRNNPGIWVSAYAGPLYCENIAIGGYLTRCFVLGEDSNNGRTGTGEVSGLTFRNCTGSLQTTISGVGPCWDITGTSFWIFFYDCGGNGNVINSTPYTYNSAAFLIDGRTNAGNGLVFFHGETNTTQGGIILAPGTNGGSVFVDDITQEGSFTFGSPVAPCVWITADGASGNVLARINNAQIADGGSTQMPAVQNDGGSSGVFVTNAFGVKINTQGVMTSFAEYTNNYQNMVVSQLRQGQTGFFDGKVVGVKDDVRRNFLSCARFVNQGRQNTVSWGVAPGVTFTQSIAAPDGTLNAGRISNANTFQAGVYFNVNGAGQQQVSFSVGDWVIIGCWVRTNSGTGGVNPPLSYALVSSGFTFVGNVGQIFGYESIQGDGEWKWVYGLGKIATIGTNPSYIEFEGTTDSTHVLDFCYPVQLHIPSGTISDNEAFEIANTLVSSRDDSLSGIVSIPRNTTFMADGIRMPKITSAIAAPGADMGFLRWEAGTNAGTLKLVAYAGTSTTGVTITDNIGAGN